MKKLIKRIILICSALCMLYLFLSNTVMLLNAKNKIVAASEAYEYNADCILVLGAGVKADGTPSNMLEDRLLTAIELYKNGSASKLLMSGDHGSVEYDEVGCMKSFAMEMGVPEEDIFLDHAGFSTYESAVRAREVFGAEKVIIVTQSYHLYRAIYDAEAFNLSCIGVSADIREYRGQLMRDIRECAARAKDFIYTIIKPSPTYLGDKISLGGSGTVTNG